MIHFPFLGYTLQINIRKLMFWDKTDDKNDDKISVQDM